MICWLRQRAPVLRNQALLVEGREYFGLELTVSGLKNAKKRYGVRTSHHRGLLRGDPANPCRLWSERQLDWLRRAYRTLPEKDLKDAMDKAFPGHGFSQAQIAGAISRYRIHSGRDGRFQRGDAPWNKGANNYNAGGRSVETLFQPGHQGAVKFPLGHERLNKDGYVEIKVAERNPYTGGPARYRLKARVIWEQTHGERVPPHHAIAFRDGDRYNFDPDNLACIPRAALLLLNRDGHGDLTGELRTAAIALAEVKAVMFKRLRAAE